MKTPLNLIRCLLLTGAGALGWLDVQAQITFTLADLPSQIGGWQRAYASSNVAVAARLGQLGGPQRWDFSEARGMNEIVKRTDIVAADDGGHETSFPWASYAEREADEPAGTSGWRYYHIDEDEARLYHGFYNATVSTQCPAKVFEVPTPDVPASVAFGQTWSRSVDWNDCYGDYPLRVHFTADASVDAYGTLALAEIGEVHALRVNEVHTWVTTFLSFGVIVTNYYRNYYWLVPGIGKAVDILSDGQLSVPPPAFATARSLLRVFEVRPWRVADLRIRLQGEQAILDWRQETNTSGYRVEMRRVFFPDTTWELLAEPTNPSWSESLTGPDPVRFFRVFVKP